MPRWATFAVALVLAGCTAETVPPAPRATGLRWGQLSPMPTPRTEVAATVADGRIVVAGGFAEPDRTVSTVEVYDIASDTWSSGPDLTLAVNHAMAASLAGEAYVVGGTLGDGTSSDAAFVLRDGGWQTLPPMPEPRTAGGAAVAGGLIHVVGGVGPDGVAERTLVFDPATQRWSVADGLGTPREHMGVAGLGDRVYAVGGRAGSLAGFGDVEVFDPGSGRWTVLPDLPTPRGGMAATGTSNGFVVAAGGEEQGGTFDEVEAFDIEEERWVRLPPMPTARHGVGVVANGTTVYVIAGGVDPGLSFSGAVELVDLAPLR
ncbi:MAG: Kelch repeat-containing protein [Actinomycetota bacterium]